MILFKKTVEKIIDDMIKRVKEDKAHSVCRKHTLSSLKRLKKDLGL